MNSFRGCESDRASQGKKTKKTKKKTTPAARERARRRAGGLVVVPRGSNRMSGALRLRLRSGVWLSPELSISLASGRRGSCAW